MTDDVDGADAGDVDTTAREDSEEEEAEDERVNVDNFYQWGSDIWDIIVNPLPDAVCPTLADLQEHDAGVSRVFESMRDGVPRKRTKLMCEMRGVTRLNFGLDAFVADVLQPYNTLVCRLQTTSQPVAHLVKEWFLQFFDEMNNLFLRDSKTFGRNYQEWKNRGNDTDADEQELRKGIESMGRQFAHDFMTNVRYRIQPYWGLLMACELANPCSPKDIASEAWDAARDLMRRTDKFTDAEIEATVKNLREQRQHHSRSSAAEEHRMKGNLLKFYHDRFRVALNSETNHDFVLCDEFFRLVTSLYISSAVVESYFSRTKYIKNKHRSLLSDNTASATMHLREMSTSQHVETLSDRNPDPYSAHKLCQRTYDDFCDKYVDREIAKEFVDPNGDGVVKRVFRGVVTHVTRGEVKGTHKWLMHVQYDSDSDEEDLEEYEIKRYIL